MKERTSNTFAVTGKEGQLHGTNRYLRVQLNLLCHGTDPLPSTKNIPKHILWRQRRTDHEKINRVAHGIGTVFCLCRLFH